MAKPETGPILSGNILHSVVTRNMSNPNMHLLNNRTTGQKTGFRDPGHENGHKPSDEIY